MIGDASFGIVAMELYFPKLYIDQTDFERAKGIPSGKITKGLGQDEMAFTSACRDATHNPPSSKLDSSWVWAFQKTGAFWRSHA